MSEQPKGAGAPRIVTPEEARWVLDGHVPENSLAQPTRVALLHTTRVALLHTVATAPEREEARTRAAVVRALRKASLLPNVWDEQGELSDLTDAIKNGAPLP